MPIVRTNRNYGPCNQLGEFVRETATGYSYRDSNGKLRRVAFQRKPKWAGEFPPAPHLEPCRLCQDHPDTIWDGKTCIHGNRNGAGHCESCLSG